jgi:hypothetical protein
MVWLDRWFGDDLRPRCDPPAYPTGFGALGLDVDGQPRCGRIRVRARGWAFAAAGVVPSFTRPARRRHALLCFCRSGLCSALAAFEAKSFAIKW